MAIASEFGPRYVDIHCHLDDERYDHDREALIARLAETGGAAITIGTDLASSRRAVELARAYPNVRACVGVYPVGIHALEADVDALDDLLSGPDADRIVAVGECGLDYAGKPTDDEIAEQKRLFLKQAEVASKHGRVVMVHCRDAYEDFIALAAEARRLYGEAFRFHMHFFAGDAAIAARLLALGATFSFTGVVTFAAQYDEVVRTLPLEAVMAETDAPYVTPKPYRGTRNEPAYVERVIERIAEVRGMPVGETYAAIRANVRRVFGV